MNDISFPSQTKVGVSRTQNWQSRLRVFLLLMIASLICVELASAQDVSVRKLRLDKILLNFNGKSELTESDAADLVLLYTMARQLKVSDSYQYAHEAAMRSVIASPQISVAGPASTNTSKQLRIQDERERLLQEYFQPFDTKRANRRQALNTLEFQCEAALTGGMTISAPALASAKEYELLKTHRDTAVPALVQTAEKNRHIHQLSSYLAIRRCFSGVNLKSIPKIDLVSVARNPQSSQSHFALHVLAIDGHFNEVNEIVSEIITIPNVSNPTHDSEFIEYLQSNLKTRSDEFEKNGYALDLIGRGDAYWSLGLQASPEANFSNAISDYDRAILLLEAPRERARETHAVTMHNAHFKKALVLGSWAKVCKEDDDKQRLTTDAEYQFGLAIVAAEATSPEAWKRQQLSNKAAALDRRATLYASRGFHEKAILDWNSAASLRPGRQAQFEERADSNVKIERFKLAGEDYQFAYANDKKQFSKDKQRDPGYRRIYLERMVRLLIKANAAAISANDSAATQWARREMDTLVDCLFQSEN